MFQNDGAEEIFSALFSCPAPEWPLKQDLPCAPPAGVLRLTPHKNLDNLRNHGGSGMNGLRIGFNAKGLTHVGIRRTALLGIKAQC